MLNLGSKVLYCGEKWTVGAIAWFGERYYFLHKGKDVAMVPGTMVSPIKMKVKGK